MVGLVTEHNKNLIGISRPYPGHVTFFNDREAITRVVKRFATLWKNNKKRKKKEVNEKNGCLKSLLRETGA